jgi:hypothetical protein
LGRGRDSPTVLRRGGPGVGWSWSTALVTLVPLLLMALRLFRYAPILVGQAHSVGRPRRINTPIMLARASPESGEPPPPGERLANSITG